MGRKSRIKKRREQSLPPRKVRQVASLVNNLEGKTFATKDEAIEAALGLPTSIKNELNRPLEEDN